MATFAAVVTTPPAIAVCIVVLRALGDPRFESPAVSELFFSSLVVSIVPVVLVAVLAPLVGMMAIREIRRAKRWLGAGYAAGMGALVGGLPFLLLWPAILWGERFEGSRSALLAVSAFPLFGLVTGVVTSLVWWYVAIRKNPELAHYRVA